MTRCLYCERELEADELELGLCPYHVKPWSNAEKKTKEAIELTEEKVSLLFSNPSRKWQEYKVKKESKALLETIRKSEKNRDKAAEALLRLGAPASTHIVKSLKGADKDYLLATIPILVTIVPTMRSITSKLKILKLEKQSIMRWVQYANARDRNEAIGRRNRAKLLLPTYWVRLDGFRWH
jgi:hypothetical protein